jgi:tetratricopeptide (TPR) repeat protein
MAFNKSKALESALKSLNQGKLAHAISEYQQILRHDPKDQVTLMTVGDLLVRQGDTRQATEYFERLAQVYLGDGFNSKAIAIYKKIAKLTPAETAPVERLAELYVQQGVLSEARPLFLQLAETHLKAERSQQAVEVLRRLLEVEPDNARVQTRLAELYLASGRKKEAAQAYLDFARRLYEAQELREAQKMMDKALEIEPTNTAAATLKAQALAAGNHMEQALTLLEGLPDAEAGGDTTALLIHLALKAGKSSRAVDLARKSFTHGAEHYPLAFKVVETLLEEGQADVALDLLGEIREAMIEAGEHDRLGHALANLSDALPGRLEPLEWEVDLYRRASDPFRLPDAIVKLADASAAAGQVERAETLLNELLERTPENENVLRHLNQVRSRQGREPASPIMIQVEKTASVPEQKTASATESTLDEETQRYVNQALTDVDLFSSYGLTQKAIHLLENVLERAPGHMPTIERLFDLYLGAGDERRTAELAGQLEQLHLQRGDSAGAERFAELRRRFQRVAGLTEQDLTAAAQPAPPAEFSVPGAEPEPAMEEPTPAISAEVPIIPEAAPAATAEMVAATPIEPPPEAPLSAAPPAATPEHEIDLSEEWMSLAQEITETPQNPLPVAPAIPESIPLAEIASAASDEPVTEEGREFEFELVPTSNAAQQDDSAETSTDQFLNQLAAEVDGLEPPTAAPSTPASEQVRPQPREPVRTSEEGENLNQLREVFQEFRAELGEMGGDDEDLETHYNLGIAYREMGLLDEAIGEFQKVAKAIQRGEPFRYAMQCSTLLGLTFMAKGEPKIATVWYERALETPALDQESVLALRYDLGVAQELAGETDAALESFRQVYAMNIDYRDVAERIAALQKH